MTIAYSAKYLKNTYKNKIICKYCVCAIGTVRAKIKGLQSEIWNVRIPLKRGVDRWIRELFWVWITALRQNDGYGQKNG